MEHNDNDTVEQINIAGYFIKKYLLKWQDKPSNKSK